MDAIDPVSPSLIYDEIMASVRQQYETAYQIHKKALEARYECYRKAHGINYEQRITIMNDLITSQTQQILAYEQQFQEQGGQLKDQAERIDLLQSEIAELKEGILKVSGMTKHYVDQKKPDTDTESIPESDFRPEVPEKVKTRSDLPLRQEKELPPRPTSHSSSIIHEIEEMIVEIQSCQNKNSSPGCLEQVSSESSNDTQTPPYTPPQRRSTPLSSRLTPIGEYENSLPTKYLGMIQDNNSKLEEIKTMPLLPPDAIPYTLEACPVSLPTPPPQPPIKNPRDIHPLLRNPPSSHDLPLEYLPSRGPSRISSTPNTPTSSTFSRKDSFLANIYKKNTPIVQEPEIMESDDVIRARIRAVVESRKAAAFGPEDRIRKSEVIHTMSLFQKGSPKAEPAQLGVSLEEAELRLKTPEPDHDRIIMSDENIKGKKSPSRLKGVVKKWRSSVWNKRSDLEKDKSSE